MAPGAGGWVSELVAVVDVAESTPGRLLPPDEQPAIAKPAVASGVRRDTG